MADGRYADEIMAKLFADAQHAANWREAKSFYVHLDTSDQNIRAAFGVPPSASATFDDLTEMLRRVQQARQQQPPPPREVFRCTAAFCGVTAAYRLRYYDIVTPDTGNWNETVCTGHALVIGGEARQRGIKLVMYPVNEVTHQVPYTYGASFPCCGRSPFDVDRLDRMTENPREVTCKPLRF